MVTVICVVAKGDLPIGIKWTFNGRPIETLQEVNLVRSSKRVSQLTIDNVKDYHSGEYVCAAKNKAGITRHSAYLRVNGTR